jgi:uncharacterized protein YlaN (UPF0358 family)
MRLINKTHKNISIQLNTNTQPACPSFRRVPLTSSILIERNSDVDLCALLGLPEDDVVRIVEKSSDVRSMHRRGLIELCR